MEVALADLIHLDYTVALPRFMFRRATLMHTDCRAFMCLIVSRIPSRHHCKVQGTA
jgi:hypothetical protein